MNAKEAKQISLISILDQLKAKKYKETRRDIWYYSPFRNEKTASFKVNRRKNVFYDFGEGKGGNVIDFIMLYFHCEFTEALHLLKDRFNSFSFHQQPVTKQSASERKKEYEITAASEIIHPALIEYITIERSLNLKMAKKYCREIHYSIKDRKYFGIGFKNGLGGYEVRNKYVKICLGKKHYTFISNEATSLNVFESWSDYISFLTLFPKRERCSDYLILNSVTMMNKVLETEVEKPALKLSKYKMILATLDNDRAGEKALEKLIKSYPKTTVDNRVFFRKHKDVNLYLIQKSQKERGKNIGSNKRENRGSQSLK